MAWDFHIADSAPVPHVAIEEGAERIADVYDMDAAPKIAAAAEMFEALLFVQTALADWRDGKTSTTHPVHGDLNLEEVKYMVVDPVIEKVDPTYADEV